MIAETLRKIHLITFLAHFARFLTKIQKYIKKVFKNQFFLSPLKSGQSQTRYFRKLKELEQIQIHPQIRYHLILQSHRKGFFTIFMEIQQISEI